MNPLLLLSIAVRLFAKTLSIVLLRRLRDWRMGLLTAILGLMAARQSLTLAGLLRAGERAVGSDGSQVLDELSGALVSVPVFAFLFLRDRVLSERRVETVGCRRAENPRESFRSVLETTPGFVAMAHPEGRLVGGDHPSRARRSRDRDLPGGDRSPR